MLLDVTEMDNSFGSVAQAPVPVLMSTCAKPQTCTGRAQGYGGWGKKRSLESGLPRLETGQRPELCLRTALPMAIGAVLTYCELNCISY